MSVRGDGRAGGRKRSKSRDRERDRETDNRKHKKRSRERERRSRSRSRSYSPGPHKHSHRHRHGDRDGARHSRHKKHKRHKDNRDDRTRSRSSSRRRSHSPSPSSIHAPSASSTAAHADSGDQSSSAAPTFPSEVSLEVARSLLGSLLALDPSSHDDLLFLIFQLDHQHSIIIEHIAHPQAKQLLQRLVHTLNLQKTTEEGGEAGWKVWEQWADRKLLPELEEAFDEARKRRSKHSVVTAGAETNGESTAAAEMSERVEGKAHPTAMVGPALPPPSYRPLPIDQPMLQPTIDVHDRQDEDEDEAEAGYGPRLASQLTADEIAALDNLQRARQQLKDTQERIQHLRSTTTTSAAAPLTHEEWMTVVPDAKSGQSALMASMSGDNAMKGRSFAMRGGGSGGDRDSSGWTAGPEEREWRRMEREAEKVVEKALTQLRSVQHRVHNTSTHTSVNTLTPRTSAPPAHSSATEPSLLELHRERLKAAQSNVVRERGAPIMWDREKEMGMRRHKTDKQISGELRGAGDLSSRFAMGT